MSGEGAELRLEYWMAYRLGAREPQLWGAVPSVRRAAGNLSRTPLVDREIERHKLEHVERAAILTIEWLLAQDHPGEARDGLERPGSPYWLKWVGDRVWQRIGPFQRPDRRLCPSCGERAVVEDELERVSRCLGCGSEEPHEVLPF